MSLEVQADLAPERSAEAHRLPALPMRVVMVFFAPGRLFTVLRERPRWGAAVLLGGLAIAASFYLVPVEMWVESFREQMLRSGRAVPEGFQLGGATRIIGTVAGAVTAGVMIFFQAAVLTLVFRFFLGDEARYTQYLAVASHAQLIAALGALMILPLRLAQGDPQLTLNLGLFIPFEGTAYPFRVLRMIDLFMVWSFVVMGLGVSKMDPRRSWGSATAFLLFFLLCMVMVVAIFVPAV